MSHLSTAPEPDSRRARFGDHGVVEGACGRVGAVVDEVLAVGVDLERLLGKYDELRGELKEDRFGGGQVEWDLTPPLRAFLDAWRKETATAASERHLEER